VNKRPEFSITSLIIFSDIWLFVTSVLSEEPWKYDSKVIPMPWRETEADAIKARLASGG
jgi:amidase